MNHVSGNVIAAQRDIFDLPVCDLGWADAFAFAESVATMPFGQSVVAFLDAGKAGRMLRDPEYRSVLERQVVLPDGRGVAFASRLLHGRRLPANLKGTDFVPAMLTYIAKPMRVGLIGAQPATLRRAAEHFRRHSPWHIFLPIADGAFDRTQSDEVMERVRTADLDILLVAMESPMQEKWIDRHVGPGHARLVLGVGDLFETVAGERRVAPRGARRLGLDPARLRQWRFELALAFHALRYRFSGRPAAMARKTAKASSL